MRQAHFFALVVAALMAGTTWASAQGFVDDPPGWAFQKRGIIESNGESPFDYYGSRRHFAAWHYRHWRGPYSWAYVHHPRYRRYWRHW
jgi:hypothetical protein